MLNASLEPLIDAIATQRAMLFAGAGTSISVGLPSWAELMAHLRSELQLGEVDSKLNHYTLAEYYRLKMGSIGLLRSWMDRHWHISRETLAESEIHNLIVGLDFPLIYTTNYDNCLEDAHKLQGKSFVKIANTHDFTRIDGLKTQIVKYHGDFSDDSTLVITETDYFKRLNFEAPLDLKFKLDALGRTILFIGYSVSDLNIRLLLYRLWEIWKQSGRERDRPGVYVFIANPDPIQTTVLQQWGITVLSGAGDPQESLTNFLRYVSEAVAARKLL